MKAVTLKNSPKKLIGEIQFARLRVARAESQLTSAKEQVRIARRRRKEAKQAARRAKKEARLAKREFTDAKLAVAELEEKLSRSEQRAARAKTKPKLVRKSANHNRGKKPAANAVPGSPKKKTAGKPRKPRTRIERKVSATKQPITAASKFAALEQPQSSLVPQLATGSVQGAVVGSISESQPDGHHHQWNHYEQERKS